ncbi:MAG TPA: hypothetical protein DDW52_01205 [Planctomycetaceae bacterium]|nr:hypothetical protein [Planctomycetaceae bacterium]
MLPLGNASNPTTRVRSAVIPQATEVLLLVAFLLVNIGCRRLAPIHVWQAGQFAPPPSAKLALGPVAGAPPIARRLEQELFAQRPAARSDLAMFTAEQLHLRSPVKLASTAALSHDALAIKAAKSVGADVLLQGEILVAELAEDDQQEPQGQIDYNNLYFAQPEETPDEHLLVSWRLIDVKTSQVIGAHSVNLRSSAAKEQYPELFSLSADQALEAAVARETWKALAPTVGKDNVRLATSTLMPGSIGVRFGNRYARRGDWATAERHWQRVTDWFPLNASAQHNLALAHAAKEDFQAAKQQLQKARGPLAFRLPSETLFWLDVTHKNYVEAHQLPPPVEGWAIARPEQPITPVTPVQPIDIDDLPWWTAIPGAKPPGWTWQDWLSQPFRQ